MNKMIVVAVRQSAVPPYPLRVHLESMDNANPVYEATFSITGSAPSVGDIFEIKKEEE